MFVVRERVNAKAVLVGIDSDLLQLNMGSPTILSQHLIWNFHIAIVAILSMCYRQQTWCDSVEVEGRECSVKIREIELEIWKKSCIKENRRLLKF